MNSATTRPMLGRNHLIPSNYCRIPIKARCRIKAKSKFKTKPKYKFIKRRKDKLLFPAVA